MQYSNIVKKEYYKLIVSFNIEHIIYMTYDDEEVIISIIEDKYITIPRHRNDADNSLKSLYLDIYTLWKSYNENYTIMRQYEDDEQ